MSGFEVGQGFDRQAAVALDSLSIQATITARDAIPLGVRYKGMVVYVQDAAVKKTYILKNGITNADWEEDGGAVSPDVVIGPVSSNDGGIPTFDGVTGKKLRDSGAVIDTVTGKMSVSDFESANEVNAPQINGTNIHSISTLQSDAETYLGGRLLIDTGFDTTSTGDHATLVEPSNIRMVISNTGLNSIDNITYATGQDGRLLSITNDTGKNVIINNNLGIFTGTGAAVNFPNGATFDFVFDGFVGSWLLKGAAGSGNTSVRRLALFTGEDISTWTKGKNATFLGAGTLAGTFASNTSTPIQGDSSYQYTQASGSLNDWIASPAKFVEPRFRNKQLKIALPFLYNGNTNDIQVMLWDATNNGPIQTSFFINQAIGPTPTALFTGTFFMPSSCASLIIGFQTKVANTGAVFKFDSIEVTDDLLVYANTANIGPWIDAGPITISSTSGAVPKGAVQIDRASYFQDGPFADVEYVYRHTTAGAAASAGGIVYTLPAGLEFDSSQQFGTLFTGTGVGSSADVFLANRVASRVGTASIGQGANGTIGAAYAYAVNSTQFQLIVYDFSGAGNGSIQNTNYFQFTTANLGIKINLRFKAKGFSASSTNLITANDVVSSDNMPFVYAPSTTYTLATLANAPVGTFITYTYTANNNRTQTTTAPTQTTADMNSNGILLYTKAFTAASTIAAPSCFAIQIGKGLKGVSLNLYKSAAKVNAGSLDFSCFSTIKNGASFRDYNEATGILVLDAAYDFTGGTVTSNFIFDDVSSQTSGYVTINASKNPAMTGINVTPGGAAYNSTAGGVMAVVGTGYYVNFENKEFDPGFVTQGTNMTTTAALAWRFTADESTFYDVKAVLKMSNLVNQNTGLGIDIIKNVLTTPAVVSEGVYTSVTTGSTAGEQGTQTVGEIYLLKGETISLRATQYAAASKALVARSSACRVSIVKSNRGQ